MTELLVDTDVLIDHLRGARPFDRARDTVSYSLITRCELFAGATADERRIREFLQPFEELTIDRVIAERAGRIRRTGLRIADALIAATALEHRLTLLTRNRRDFDHVRGLKVRSPG
jgi:predicted nucleic acid-binding protein